MKKHIFLTSMRLITALALPVLAQDLPARDSALNSASTTVTITTKATAPAASSSQLPQARRAYDPEDFNDRMPTLQTAPAPATEPVNKAGFWGAGVGYIFTSIPISESKFTQVMSEFYYSHYLNDPNASFRTAATLGLYGFDLILPVPKVSLDMYLGDPDQDIQGKFGVGGFYDISVGGAAGVSLEAGVRIKNHVNVSFLGVPAGIDSKRDYLEFIGERTTPGPKPYVLYPFYGLFLSFDY